jgi:wyosine [tRNA(Phe)-imidazoG37] synthetase (radical SAM superfamily)
VCHHDFDSGFSPSELYILWDCCAGKKVKEMEDYVAMERRHQEELQQLQETTKAMLKAAKKSTRTSIETQVIQMGYDLKAKHREEMNELEERLGVDVVDSLAASLSSSATVSSQQQSEEEIAKAKKAKAKKKQDKKASKEKEREETKQQIHSEVGGQSQREAELQTLRAQLAKEHLTIKDIPSDGNCLYR